MNEAFDRWHCLLCHPLSQSADTFHIVCTNHMVQFRQASLPTQIAMWHHLGIAHGYSSPMLDALCQTMICMYVDEQNATILILGFKPATHTHVVLLETRRPAPIFTLR